MPPGMGRLILSTSMLIVLKIMVDRTFYPVALHESPIPNYTHFPTSPPFPLFSNYNSPNTPLTVSVKEKKE